MLQIRRQKSVAMTLVVLLVVGPVILLAGCAPVDADRQLASESSTVVDHETVLELLTTRDAASICRKIRKNWHPGIIVMLLEIVRFNQNSETGSEVLKLLEEKSRQNFQLDMNKWFQWVWSKPYNPHPEYGEFKRKVYVEADPVFSEYFEKTDNAEIRLDEIRWGGVERDGIPPLKNPKMISPNEATYLADSNIVFGVIIDGDARCYPKRILAWHEMFKDTIGGRPVCGAY